MAISKTNCAGIGRRQFLWHVGRGMMAAGVGQQLANFAGAAERPTPQSSVKSAQKEATVEKETDPAEALVPERRVGFALIGLGRLSVDQLIPAFAASNKAKLVALVSGHLEEAQNLAQEHGLRAENVYSYQDFDRIRDNRDVKAVYIVLPNSMHSEYTIRAARAGKHVLCEKPMEVSSEKCQQMIEACARANVKLMIAYRIQYEPMNRSLQRLVRNKTFGAIKFIESVHGQVLGDPNQWRLSRALSGSGSLGDLGVYCMNTIRFLLGEEPTEVFGQTIRPGADPCFKEVDETVIWQMKFPSGVVSNCACSFNFQDRRSYRISAERGDFGMDPAFAYRGLKVQMNRADSQVGDLNIPTTETKNQFALEIDHMADCVLNNRKPYTPGEEGLQDQRIIEAIFESAANGRIVKMNAPSQLDAFRGPPPT